MWSLYQNNKFLEPLVFSNGKSQEDIVREVLNAVKEGHKIIFIHGICGTGKSVIALNIARKLGKTSIIVPGKNLQTQYQKDYEEEKYLLKEDKTSLKINIITGRNNHKCKFLEDCKDSIPREIKEINSRLNDIFEGKREEINKLTEKDLSADNKNIPCKIEIKEKNWNKIKQYIKQNKKINARDISDLKDVRRFSVAGACPYWCPVLPEMYELKGFDKKRKYMGLNNTNFVFYQGKSGCKFYEQFNSFIDSDVIVFNSLKYKLESALNRKPLTEVEIIDECDEFLDSFSNQRNISLERLQNSLARIFSMDKNTESIIENIQEIVRKMKKDEKINKSIATQEIIPLKETGIYDLFKIFIKSNEFLDEVDDESYLFDVEESARMFEDFLNESYVTFNKKENNLTASVVTVNLAKRFKEMIDKNKLIVLMSGTLHSRDVLKNIFGLNNFKVIDAETEQQGRIEIQRTGLEMDCKYSNFSNEKFSRKDYLEALDKSVETAKKPVLIHVNSFIDLPSEQEIKEFRINNLLSREKLKEIQTNDKTGELVDSFKKGEMNVLFSTKCARGIDFPGEQCNSIVFTKYPNPNVKDAFWKILQKTNPQNYWEFYKDKAKRELWQKIYRGLRFKEDHVYVLSPDSRVIEAFEREKK